MARKSNVASIEPLLLEAYIDDIPLDRDTPCGLFETTTGDRMLVAQNEDQRVAIALSHWTMRPFEWQRLERRPLATGNWLGNFQIELTHRLRSRSDATLPGTLGIMEHKLYLDCHPGEGDYCGIPIGEIDYSNPLTDYDGWRILKDGKVFFEKLPQVANWRKVLSVRDQPES